MASSSIFYDVKKLLGIEISYTAFDPEILVGINTAINVLGQIGVGPYDGLIVTGSEETWDQLFRGYNNLELVKQYVYLRTRRIFDPPSSSSVMQAIDNEIKELEWRINTTMELRRM